MGNKVDTMSAHIDTAKKTRVFSYVGKKCMEVPPAVLNLATTVRTVDFSDNKLKILPIAMGNFVELKQLILEHNELAEVQKELSNMKKLEVLNLGYNKLTKIPTSFSKFTNLKSIHLNGNQMTVFPGCLCDMKHLNLINLSDNKLEELPEQMESLQVIELNLNTNQLNSLPGSLVRCPRLKVLRVEENLLELGSITSELLENSQISLLAVDGNRFQMKALYEQDGYDKYMERYTATKKKYI